jgi:predicted transcriptional regulator
MTVEQVKRMEGMASVANTMGVSPQAVGNDLELGTIRHKVDAIEKRQERIEALLMKIAEELADGSRRG